MSEVDEPVESAASKDPDTTAPAVDAPAAEEAPAEEDDEAGTSAETP